MIQQPNRSNHIQKNFSAPSKTVSVQIQALDDSGGKSQSCDVTEQLVLDMQSAIDENLVFDEKSTLDEQLIINNQLVTKKQSTPNDILVLNKELTLYN
ncbi:hypothetical protein PtB15_9B266 [Puccinia triticina]|nr:hypothetical protein PtB15_9B266 [Puccinia triticina]